MRDYRIRLKLKSHSGTPWQSDTIFGHLCWQVVYGAIDADIQSFLKPFLNGKPPFVLSDGFPAGMMPRPLLMSAPDPVSTVEEYAANKRWRKAVYYTLDDFLRVCRGGKPEGEPLDDPWLHMITPHASLDRITNTTSSEGGGFYETESESLKAPSEIDIYARCENGWDEKLRVLFKAMSKTGFGRDKSVGLGAFEVVSLMEFDRFSGIDRANGFISLSTMVPAEGDPTDAYYRLRLKVGKLGESASGNPFKKPLLQMEPGAVFRTDRALEDYYGTVITGLAPGKPEAVQNCYCLAVPYILN